jgi:hypothetical protein
MGSPQNRNDMKFTIILLVSLAAGLALGTAMRKWQTPAQRVSPGLTAVTNIVTNHVVRTIDTPASEATNDFARTESFRWSMLQSSDAKKFVANLRAVGCPEQTVKDIILAMVNKQFAPRFAAVKGAPNAFWKPTRLGYVSTPDQRKELAALEKERGQLLKDLLGYDVKEPDHRGYVPPDRSEVAFLSEERRAALEQPLKEAQDRHEKRLDAYLAEVQKRGGRDLQPLWAQLQVEKRNDLAKLLTPAELEEYDLRNSYLAADLRHNLSGFKPSPEEFRGLYRLQQSLVEKVGGNPFVSGKSENMDAKDWDAAKQQMLAQVKDKLGEERFAVYQRSQNANYQELIRAADQYDLPQDLPDKIWSVRESAEETRRRLLAMQNLSDEQRQAALNNLASQTSKEVETLMGADAFRRYRTWHPTFWTKDLTNIVAPPR